MENNLASSVNAEDVKRCGPAKPSLHKPQENMHQDTCSRIFITALSIISKKLETVFMSIKSGVSCKGWLSGSVG